MNKKPRISLCFDHDDLIGMKASQLADVFNQLPEDTMFLGTFNDPMYFSTNFIFESSKFIETNESHELPRVSVSVNWDSDSFAKIDLTNYMKPKLSVDTRSKIYEDELDYHNLQKEINAAQSQIIKNMLVFGSSTVKVTVDPMTKNPYYLIYNPVTQQMEDHDEESDLMKTYYNNTPNESGLNSSCDHNWVPYQGFVEQYDWCDVPGCKAKRDFSG